MRVLIVSPRFPEYGRKGDQLRARQLVDLLTPEHELHVISGGRPSEPGALDELTARAPVTLIEAGRLSRGLSALWLLSQGHPAQVGWMSPPRLRSRIVSAALDSDVVIAVTSRAVTARPAAPLVLDHIDALSVNMRERSRLEHRPLLRCGARLEARLLARHERTTARWASAQLAVSDLDAAALPQPPPITVIPHTVSATIGASELCDTQANAGRDIDVIFTGNMDYPPNRSAAGWLAGEILPELRRLRPQTSVVVAGRGATRLSLGGVGIASDVPDLSVLLRRARVAIVPLRSGTGVPNKLLEAAAYGAAVVATPRAAQAAGVAAVTAEGASGLAAAVVALLDDEPGRVALAGRALEDLGSRAPDVVAAQLREALANVVDDRRAAAP